MSVVGIDFGLDTCFVSVARGGGIEVIANDYSLRDTPSMVAFSDRQRVMGVAAKQKLLTNLKKSFYGFKTLLGRLFDDPIVAQEAQRLSFKVSRGPQNKILVHVDFLGESREFTPEQLTGMLLTKLKETAESALQTKVKDVVISVPLYFDDAQRRALLDAAQIAGLNVLRLMNDTTATALAYGIYKQDLSEDKARNVVFVDCGHYAVQTAACAFHKGKLAMQSAGFEKECGGRAFSEKLVNFFSDEFDKKYRLKVHSNAKAKLKLMSEVEKIKKQMSANTNKLPLNIECFMEDKDVSGHVDRATFEELIQPELIRIEQLLLRTLEDCKWKKEDIYAVEIIGGSTRVPAIKALIEKVFNKSPATTLNADEAVSRGCALQCAILSPTFKVREFSVTDLQPFPIKLKWEAESDKGEMLVFPQNHPVPFSKLLTFYRRDNFAVEGHYESNVGSNEENSKIGVFEVGDVVANEEGGNQKVKLKVRVNINGVFGVVSASIVEKQQIEVEEPMETNEETANQEKKDTNEEKKMETDEKEKGEPMESESDKATTTPSDKASAPPKMVKRLKTVQKSVELPITSIVKGALSMEKLERAVEIERWMTRQDELERDRLHAKNAVEEYIYDLRAKIFDELADFVNENNRAKLAEQLEAMENWLYEEGEECNKEEYEQKLKDLKSQGEGIKIRKLEHDLRPASLEALGHSLQMAEKIVELFKNGDERYDHLDKTEVEKVEKTIKEKRAWLNETCSAVAALDKTKDPPVLVSQIRNEQQNFDKIASPILNRSKPKPPEPKVEEPKTKSDDSKGDNNTANQEDVAVNGDQAKMELD